MTTRARAVAGTIVFFGLAPAVVAGVIPYALTDWRRQPPWLGTTATRLAGVVLVVVGTTALVDCFRRFALEGLGTPAPVAPTERLVVSGLYRYVRNPMYLAVVGVIVGQAALLASRILLVYGGLAWLLMHLFVLSYEEPALTASFGDSYRAYRAHVRRWWPRSRAWRNPSPD